MRPRLRSSLRGHLNGEDGAWAWYAAWIEGFTRHTTVAIRSTQVENRSSRSARGSTDPSNRASR
jgi:hypothetical protein